MQCDRFMLTGGRCELDKGHKGEHQRTYGDATYYWTDEATAREADKHGSRFD